jgi:hypothetical protein
MNKSQISVFFILGIVFTILLGIVTFYLSQNSQVFYKEEVKKTYHFSDVGTDVRDYINLCIKDSATESIQETGIREDTKEKYVSLVKNKINNCMAPLLRALKDEGYNITQGVISVQVGINRETVIVDITYPLDIQKNEQKISFERFHYTFDRSVNVNIPGGVTDKEVTLTAPDGKATLKIPKGVKITDNSGNPIENIGIRVEDLHFDGLENKYNVGQTVYDNFPDGTYFSEPIELSIEFRSKDVPKGYTNDNIRLAWWNNKTGVWYATDTEISNGRATAKIYHFTKNGLVVGTDHSLFSTDSIETIFIHKYSPYNLVNNKEASPEGTKVWAISGYQDEKTVDGIATLKEDTDPSQLANCREYLLEGLKFTKPVISYGFYPLVDITVGGQTPYRENYFSDAGLYDAGSFVNCESSGEYNFLTYSMDGDSPQFKPNVACAISTCSGEPCPDPANRNPNSCTGHAYCNGDNEICIPYKGTEPVYSAEEQQNNLGLPCCLEPKSNLEAAQSKKSFGWFNFRCAGGSVTARNPSATDESGAASLLVLGNNGNGIVYVKSLLKIDFGKAFSYFHDIPEILPRTTIPTDIMIPGTNIVMEGTKGDMIARKDASYYSRIRPYEDGSLYKEIVMSGDAKTAAGFDKTAKVPAFGLNGCDVIKYKKVSDMSAVCDVIWEYWGSPATHPAPGDKSEKEQLCQTGKLFADS